MRYAGKLLGGVAGGAAGFAAAGVPGLFAGAGLGGALGGILDLVTGRGDDHGLAFEERPPTREEIDADLRRLFARHLCSVCIAVAASDGEVGPEEAHAIRAFFEEKLGFTQEELGVVRAELRGLVAAPPPVAAAAAGAASALDEGVRLLLFQALYELALADGPLSRAEQQALEAAAEGLQIGPEDRGSIRALFFAAADRAYELLGLGADAPDAELKRRYRALAVLHHPDKVASLGPEAVKLAEAKFREISDAYEEVRRERGG